MRHRLERVFVSLTATPTRPAALASAAISARPTDVDSALALAQVLASTRSEPGTNSTRDLWEALATVAAADLGAARALEPHLDAMAIMHEAGESSARGAWGVFAAEGGDDPLVAQSTAGEWSLTGTKPWCSLADRLDWALITARTTTGESRLFAVDMTQQGVLVNTSTWMARGLSEVPSGPVRFDHVLGSPVGDPGWYLERPGFAVGGIGVAACWFGGAVGLGRTVHRAAEQSPNPFLLAHLGAIDELLQSCRRALFEATHLIGHPAIDGRILAKRVRATVARSCEEIIGRTGHALGPAALALDATHAKRVADLQLYVRQHHAERDQASLGTALAVGPAPW